MPGKVMLLLHKRTWLPVPAALRAGDEQLAAALRHLPLLGFGLGTVQALLALQLAQLPLPLAAVALLCLDLLSGGGVLLVELMWFASALPVAEAADGQAPAQPPRTTAALIGGAAFLLLRFGIYYYLPRLLWGWQYILPLLRCLGGFCYLWLAYDFAARVPAKLHRGLRRADLLFGGAVLLLGAAFLSLWRGAAALIPALLPGLLIAWAPARLRADRLGGLTPDVYGAAAAAAETVFALSYIVLSRFL
ncbi:MAG: hypothetical protein IKM70_04595 [Firmicutes bacterium]|nr:hypothetical protein [Bacillota bacterium]